MKQTLLTFIIALLAATGAWAQTTFTVNNLKYTVTDAATHTVELTGYESALAGEVNIPATVTNESTEYSVTSIGSLAFSSCSSLTAVTISDGVTSIGHGSDHTRGSSYHRRLRIRKVLLPHGSDHTRQRN